MSRLAALASIAALVVGPSPPAYVVGFVQDTNCAPLPGAQISIGESSTPPVVTDAQGRFVVSVPEGRDRVDLSARIPGFRRLTRTNVRVGPGARDSHTLTLHPMRPIFADPIITSGGRSQIVPESTPDERLRGEVLTTACTPVQDAQITVTGLGSELRTRSDVAGRFAFPRLAHGSYTLDVRMLGYIRVVRTGTKVEEGTPPVRVLLERGDDGEIDMMRPDDGSNRRVR